MLIPNLKTHFDTYPFILSEAAVVERLRRSSHISLHPRLVHAPLIYEAQGREAMTEIFVGYLDIARKAQLPFLMGTPTWRANKERLEEWTDPHAETINGDAVAFLKDIRQANPTGQPIWIAGLIGCKNDCYKPEEGLSSEEALRFHRWQVTHLAEGGADVLMAQTLPALEEARGIARAMEETGLPYLISFVLNRQGTLMDGTTVLDAIQDIDGSTRQPPLGYLFNCAYPSFLCPEQQPQALFQRFIGCLGNASALDQAELDGADHLEGESPEAWGEAMMQLHHQFGLKLMGGCCGTDQAYLNQLTQRLHHL